MIISSEIEKVEKVEILTKAADKDQKSILRAFARTRAKKLKL
jgi:phosphate uptake regulator